MSLPCVFMQVDILSGVASPVADCAIPIYTGRSPTAGQLNPLIDCHDDSGKSSTGEVDMVDHCSVVSTWNQPGLLCCLAYLEMCYSCVSSLGLRVWR